MLAGEVAMCVYLGMFTLQAADKEATGSTVGEALSPLCNIGGSGGIWSGAQGGHCQVEYQVKSRLMCWLVRWPCVCGALPGPRTHARNMCVPGIMEDS